MSLQHNATSWDNGCQKRPLLTPFLTPVAPRRARDRVPSILALGLFLPVSDFTQPETGSPTAGDRETWASLPVLFWRVSALVSKVSRGEPGVSCRFLPGVIPRLRHPPLRLRAQTQRCYLAGYFWPPYERSRHFLLPR